MIKKSYLTICIIVAILVQSIFAFDVGATETVSMNSTQMEPESTVDVTAPTVVSLTLSKTTVSTGEKIEIVGEATDDVSGVSSFWVDFEGPNGKLISVSLYSYYRDEKYNEVAYEDGKFHGYIEPDEYKPSGEYKIRSISLRDKADNDHIYYVSGFPQNTIPENIQGLSFQYTNTKVVDVTAPTVVSLTLSKTTVSTGEKIEIVGEATDDVSGVSSFWVDFEGPNGKLISVSLYSYYRDEKYNEVAYEDGKFHGHIEPDEYKPSGEYKIRSISLRDKADNDHIYYVSGFPQNTIPENIQGLSLQYTNTKVVDVTAPTVVSLKILSNQVETPGVVEIVGEAIDDVSGVNSFWVDFEGPNGKLISVSLYSYYRDEQYNEVAYEDGKFHGEIDINQYKPSGEYKISYIYLGDKAGNSQSYYVSSFPQNTIPENIQGMTIQVVNNGRVPDVTTGTSNGNLISQISNSASDALIAVDYSSNSTVSAGVFDVIKGTDRTVVFDSDGIQWIVNGKDITSDSKPIDLKVTTKVAKNDYSEQGEQIQQITEGSNAYILQFADNGVLPGKMKVRIKLDYSMRNYLGTTGMYLYYYDPVLKEMQIIAENIDITKDNYVEFEITHCSDYVLTRGKLTNLKYVEPTDTNVDNSPSDVIINTTANAVNTGRKLDAVPKTADRTQYTLIVMMLIVSGLLMVYLGKKIADEKA